LKIVLSIENDEEPKIFLLLYAFTTGFFWKSITGRIIFIFFIQNIYVQIISIHDKMLFPKYVFFAHSLDHVATKLVEKNRQIFLFFYLLSFFVFNPG
jgi:hypothetical protein